MKGKFLRILVAAALATLGLIPAAPAVAAATLNVMPFSLSASGSSVAAWSTAQANTGSSSIHLQTAGGAGTGNEGRIQVDLATPMAFSTLNSISWAAYSVAGYPPHVDISLDTTGDGVQDEMLTAEFATQDTDGARDSYQNQIAVNSWMDTLGGNDTASIPVDDTAILWSTPDGAGTADAPWGTLAEWKAGTVANDPGSDGIPNLTSATVLGFEIECDNWILESEAYVDDIAVNGVIWYGSIQDAIDSASAADTVAVAAGTYSEQLTIDKSLTLQAGSTPIIDADEAMSAVNIEADNVTFDGFKVSNAKVGVYLKGVSGCIVTNNSFDGLSYSTGTQGVIVTDSDYPDENPSSNNTISNNDFIGAGIETGIQLGATGSNEVYGNDFSTTDWYLSWGTNPAATAIDVGPANDNPSDSNLVHDNTITSPGFQTGISVGWSTENEIYDNTIEGHTSKAIAVSQCESPSDGPNEIYNNIITGDDTDDSDIGIWIDASEYQKVYGNDVTGNAKGIYLRTEVSYNPYPTKVYEYSKNNVIEANDITGNDVGVYVGENQDETEGNNKVNYNSIINNINYGVKNDGSGTLNAEYNWWGHASGPVATASAYTAYGDPVSANVLFQPWLLAPVVPGTTPTTYDRTLALLDGWTLVSTDKEVTTGTSWAGVAVAYKYVAASGYSQVTLPTQLTSVDAFYVKATGGGGVGLAYSTAAPGVVTKDLGAGWNLISAAGETDAYALLSQIRYVQVGNSQAVGLTSLVGQGAYNQFTGNISNTLVTTAEWDAIAPGGAPVTLSPFDGFWVNMNAGKAFGVIPD